MLPDVTTSEPSPVVLVVENDVLKRLAFGSDLRRRGLQVFEAASATEAMTLLEQTVVDVILSDVSLLQASELAQWVTEHQLPTRFMWTSGQTPDTAPQSGSADRPDTVPVSPGAEHSAVVLIAEDDVLLRLATASGLRGAGFEVLEVANATEAVTVLNAVPVDALVSEVEVTGEMDGLALARWIQDRRLKTKVVLTFSGEESPGEGHEYAHFLAKPYDDLSVQQVLKRLLMQ